MQFFSSFLLMLIFLIASALLTAVNGAIRRLHLQDLKFTLSGNQFFYRGFHRYFFPSDEYEGILCATISAQNVTRFLYAFSATLFLLYSSVNQHKEAVSLQAENPNIVVAALFVLLFISLSFLIGDYIPRVLASRFPEAALRAAAPISSLFMFLAFPLTYLTLKFSKKQFTMLSFEEPLTRTKREIIEIIQQTSLSAELNVHEKNIIEAVLRFKDRIAREIMVPRVDVFSLSADTTIKQAATLIEEEGYSRIPVYKNTVDNIVGVLMYKDILTTFKKYENSGNDPAILNATIDTIQKSALYTPETKKISNLLLEFRKKQVHLAIVVDEYGGTEGIVTIEDILEEIVGEIEDEYDIEEEELFFPQHDGSWIVDGRMSILDVEQQLGVKIPQEADYDTVGGFIFHCAGSIPSTGFIIHQNEFQIEILKSDERRVEKVRIKTFERDEDDPTEGTPERDTDEGDD